jgi:hypothetical protein
MTFQFLPFSAGKNRADEWTGHEHNQRLRAEGEDAQKAHEGADNRQNVCRRQEIEGLEAALPQI